MEGIVDGGYVQNIKDRNYVIAAQYTRVGTGLKTCGGVIVSKFKALTAAHCMRNIITLQVLFGAVYLSEAEYIRQVPVENVLIYEDYRDSGSSYDISVIKFDEEIVFSDTVGKIDIVPKNFVLKTDMEITMLGYTRAEDNKRDSEQSSLGYIHSKISDFEACKELYNTHGTLRMNRYREFCVKLWEGTHCTNGGDSGG